MTPTITPAQPLCIICTPPAGSLTLPALLHASTLPPELPVSHLICDKYKLLPTLLAQGISALSATFKNDHPCCLEKQQLKIPPLTFLITYGLRFPHLSFLSCVLEKEILSSVFFLPSEQILIHCDSSSWNDCLFQVAPCSYLEIFSFLPLSAPNGFSCFFLKRALCLTFPPKHPPSNNAFFNHFTSFTDFNFCPMSSVRDFSSSSLCIK